MKILLKQPSAWIPIAMSLSVLVAFAITIVFSGPPVREVDEGVGAHLFQLWLVFEVAAIGFFAVKWIPQSPKPALSVLALQVLAVIAVCAPVRILRL